METAGQRFEYWMSKLVGTSAVKMAEMIGVEHKTIYNIINGKNTTIIGKKTLTQFKKRFPKFPWYWIRTGEGDLPDQDTAEMKEEGFETSAESRIKDMEIVALRKEIEGLKGLVDAAENNNKRLEGVIVHYEKLYEDAIEQLEKYKHKKT